MNFNLKFDHNIPLPFDYLDEKNLKLKDYKEWIPNVLMKDETFLSLKLVNELTKKKFDSRRRMYIFVIATNDYVISDFQLAKMWDPEYREQIIKSDNEPLITDFVSLCNALLFMHHLKSERIFREVYLVGDAMKQLEAKYQFLMSSNIEDFKHIPLPSCLEYHTSMTFQQFYPSEILKGILYLGDANHATNKYVMQNM